jgi:Mn-dependent DtxR family transcriptional regulator
VTRAASASVVERLDKNFFRVRFDRLTPSEKEYLRAMVRLGTGPCRVADIANCLGKKITSLAPTRAQLIKKAWSTAHPMAT